MSTLRKFVSDVRDSLEMSRAVDPKQVPEFIIIDKDEHATIVEECTKNETLVPEELFGIPLVRSDLATPEVPMDGYGEKHHIAWRVNKESTTMRFMRTIDMPHPLPEGKTVDDYREEKVLDNVGKASVTIEFYYDKSLHREFPIKNLAMSMQPFMFMMAENNKWFDNGIFFGKYIVLDNVIE